MKYEYLPSENKFPWTKQVALKIWHKNLTYLLLNTIIALQLWKYLSPIILSLCMVFYRKSKIQDKELSSDSSKWLPSCKIVSHLYHCHCNYNISDGRMSLVLYFQNSDKYPFRILETLIFWKKIILVIFF